MDLSVKTLTHLIFIFTGVFLFLGILSYFFLSLHARNSSYAIVEYLEISGYNEETKSTIEDYADKNHLRVEITPMTEEGLFGNGEKNRYKIEVAFDHFLSILDLMHETKFVLFTRAVDY